MSVEKSKKEIKERLINGAALSDDELEQVSGGKGSYNICPGFPACGGDRGRCNGGIPGYCCPYGLIEELKNK